MEEGELFEVSFDGSAAVVLRPSLVGTEWVVTHGPHEGRGDTAMASVQNVAEKVVRALVAKDEQA